MLVSEEMRLGVYIHQVTNLIPAMKVAEERSRLCLHLTLFTTASTP